MVNWSLSTEVNHIEEFAGIETLTYEETSMVLDGAVGNSEPPKLDKYY